MTRLEQRRCRRLRVIVGVLIWIIIYELRSPDKRRSMRTFSQGIRYYYDSKIKQCAMPSISAMARSLPAICLLTPISASFVFLLNVAISVVNHCPIMHSQLVRARVRSTEKRTAPTTHNSCFVKTTCAEVWSDTPLTMAAAPHFSFLSFLSIDTIYGLYLRSDHTSTYPICEG